MSDFSVFCFLKVAMCDSAPPNLYNFRVARVEQLQKKSTNIKIEKKIGGGGVVHTIWLYRAEVVFMDMEGDDEKGDATMPDPYGGCVKP